MMSLPPVRADQAKGLDVIIKMPGEDDAVCKIGTLADSGRQFVILGFRHPTCGSVKREYPKNHLFDQAPPIRRRR